MTDDQNAYREFQRRRHRVLGAYLAFWAWETQSDCVVLSRKHLLPYLGLESRMEEVRLRWMEEDLRGLFPYFLPLHYGANDKFEKLILSRKEIPLAGLTGGISLAECAKRLGEKGLDTVFALGLNEFEIIRSMADISHGIRDFSGV
jgi:hypothetical protein